jgi:enamine deaminase RidA (YjgF/YER057c/UK114 family)
MARLHAALVAGLILSMDCASALAQSIRHVESNPRTGSSAAVLVDDIPLLHTTQIFAAVDDRGNLDQQVESLFARLETELKYSNATISDLVKLNFYAASNEAAAAIRKQLPKTFLKEARPAVSFVVTKLPADDALVAADAVAALLRSNGKEVRRGPLAAIMPKGMRIYVSGQAEPGTLPEATRKTLASLSRTLKEYGRGEQDIVQIKCFLTPMESAGLVKEEIAKHFAGQKVPPVSYVEWKSSLPIEIELVAWGGVSAEKPAADPIEYLTPMGFKASPLYCRVARIHGGGTIHFSDLNAIPTVDAAAQVQQPFDRLKLLLEKTGSDFKHLAKATYYVTDDEVSKAHNEIRPKFYDPARPPAASKAVVTGTGTEGVRYIMDMIAIPSSRGTPATPPERGRGLTEQQAAEGWLSLWDGETDPGWRTANPETESGLNLVSTVRFGNCELHGKFTGAGTITIGGKEHQVATDKLLRVQATERRDIIRLGKGLAIESLLIRPLHTQPLFSGKDLSGWKHIQRKPTPAKEAAWQVENGVLRAIGGPEAIEYTEKQFGDFILQIDVHSRAVHSNGGVFFRAIAGDFMNGYEAQLHNRCLENDPAKPFRYCTGGLDDRLDARRQVARDFIPFKMTIIADGPRIATWVNGYQTIDFLDERPEHDNPREGKRTKAGVVQLQAHDPATDYEVRGISVADWK